MRNYYFYIRDSRGFPVACVAAVNVSNDRAALGISVFNPSDKYDRVLGRKIALGRAQALINRHPDSTDDLSHWVTGVNFKSDSYNKHICNLLQRLENDKVIMLPTRVSRVLKYNID